MLDHHTAVQSHFTADSLTLKHLSRIEFPENLSHSTSGETAHPECDDFQIFSQSQPDVFTVVTQFREKRWGGMKIGPFLLELRRS